MNSTIAPKTIEPDDVVVARADERLVHAYDQIARADEQLARLNEQLARLEQEPKHHPSAAAMGGHRPSRGGRALRGFVGLLLAASVFGLAFVSQSSYGEAAKSTVARWAPQLMALPSWTEKSEEAAQPGQSAVQLAAATPALPQSVQTVQTAEQDAAPAAPTTAELAQMLQTMARDLANLEQGIGQLKANQEQIARDSAKATEELKASQEQMTRLIARLSEQSKPAEPNLRLRPSATSPATSAIPARPAAAPRPVPVRQAPQARARPQAPMQLQPDDDQ
jgi:chemotaxis protein histidine kinase CheA